MAVTVAGGPMVMTAVAVGVVLVVVIVVALGIRAVRAVRRARRDRIELAVVPTSSFDPQPEEIVRYAAQLLRTHRATERLLVPAGAQMVRVALRSAGEGRMVHTVSGSARAASILRQRGFAQVELVDPEVLAGRLGGIDPADPTRTAAEPPPQDPAGDPRGDLTPPGAPPPGGQTTGPGQPTRGQPPGEASGPGWSLMQEQ